MHVSETSCWVDSFQTYAVNRAYYIGLKVCGQQGAYDSLSDMRSVCAMQFYHKTVVFEKTCYKVVHSPYGAPMSPCDSLRRPLKSMSAVIRCGNRI